MRLIGLTRNSVKSEGGVRGGTLPARALPAVAAVFALVAGLAGMTETAYAGPLDTRAVACTFNDRGGSTSRATYDAYSPATNSHRLTPMVTTVSTYGDSAQAGTLLFQTATYTLPTLSGSQQGRAAPLYNCPPGSTEQFRGNGVYDSVSKSYPTGVQGIGYRVFYYTSTSYGSENAAPLTLTNSFASGALVFPHSSSQGGTQYTRIDFVATGANYGTGIINASNIFGTSSETNNSSYFYRVQLASNITIAAPTCKVANTGNLTLALPAVTTIALNNGTAETTTYPTDLKVECDRIRSAAPTITFTTNYAASGYPGTLTNQAANGAQGVGVKLWVWNPVSNRYDVPTFNSRLSNLATYVDGPMYGRTWTFRVGASYLRTGGTVTAGPVRSTATLTFQYS